LSTIGFASPVTSRITGNYSFIISLPQILRQKYGWLSMI